MNAEEKLKELSEYIAAMTAYYMNVLSEEKIDYKKAHIEGKINVLNGVRKKMKKLDKESCTLQRKVVFDSKTN